MSLRETGCSAAELSARAGGEKMELGWLVVPRSDSFIHLANSVEIHEVDQEHVAQLDDADAFKLAIKQN